MSDTTQRTWEDRVQAKMPRLRWRRAWMLWVIWGTLGTALTLEGTSPTMSAGVATAFWLTLPFWAAFILWPLFALWRYGRDRRLAIDAIEAFSDGALTMPVLREGATVWLPVAMIEAFLEEEGLSTEAIRALGLPGPDQGPRPERGVDLTLWRAQTLCAWAEVSPNSVPPLLLKWLRQLAVSVRFKSL